MMRLRIVRVHSMHVASRATNREVYQGLATDCMAQVRRKKSVARPDRGVGVSADRGRGIPFDRTRSKGFNCFSFGFSRVSKCFQLEVNLHMVAELLREL